MAWSDKARQAALEARRRHLKVKPTGPSYMKYEPDAYVGHYYQVQKPITVYVHRRMQPSNAYYGSSRIYQAQLKPVRLQKGNELHWTSSGGLYAANRGGRRAVSIDSEHIDRPRPRMERGAFEKVYGSLQESGYRNVRGLGKKLKEIGPPRTRTKFLKVR